MNSWRWCRPLIVVPLVILAGCTGGAGAVSVNCAPSYPDVCIAAPPPDLDCGEIPYRNFRVLPSDPHGFDGDNDGIGCET